MISVRQTLENLFTSGKKLLDRHLDQEFSVPAPDSVGSPNTPFKSYLVSGSILKNSWKIDLMHREDISEGKYNNVFERIVFNPKNGLSDFSTEDMLMFAWTAATDPDLGERLNARASKTVGKFQRSNAALIRQHLPDYVL